MADEHHVGHLGDAPSAPAPDPFLRQLAWLVDAAGGQATLARRSGVAERSLRSWSRGDYPKQNDSAAIRRLDAYAVANVPGYPAEAGVPRLTETSGSAWPAPAAPPVPPPASRPAEQPAREHGASAATGVERAPRRRPPMAALAVVLAAVAVVVAVIAVERQGDDAAAVAPPTAPAPTSTPLPTRGNGTSTPEESGSLGANTFADPVLLQDQALKIPPHTTITVRCRIYAPSIPSVLPDGNWYLIDTAPWTGRWTPANSFMNGDVPGGPTLHNTDFAVPECKH